MKTIDPAKFSDKLLFWWKKNKRSFPWRDTTDPYKVLVSEVLLHRTKANQVVPVYKELVERFKTIKELSGSSLEEIVKINQSNGLRWRSESLHRMAQEIVQKYTGKIPSEKSELESLPGISHYIASAVRCFAFGYPEVLLDTNTVRILGRVFGTKVVDSSRRSKLFSNLYSNIIDRNQPREFNYAMIDLGALVCTPRNPRHHHCPVNEMCEYAFSLNIRGRQ